MIHQLLATGQGQAVICLPACEEQGNLPVQENTETQKNPEASQFIRPWVVAGSCSHEQGPLLPAQVKILGLLQHHSPTAPSLGAGPPLLPCRLLLPLRALRSSKDRLPPCRAITAALAALSPSPAPVCWVKSGGQLQLWGEGDRG